MPTLYLWAFTLPLSLPTPTARDNPSLHSSSSRLPSSLPWVSFRARTISRSQEGHSTTSEEIRLIVLTITRSKSEVRGTKPISRPTCRVKTTGLTTMKSVNTQLFMVRRILSLQRILDTDKRLLWQGCHRRPSTHQDNRAPTLSFTQNG